MTARVLNAATWYASSDGTQTNGTYTLPWGVLYAITNTNPHLAAGDSVIFKSNGIFTCGETNSDYSVGHVVHFRKSGTSADKITYRSETPWSFTFDGGIMLTIASNIVLKELRVYYSGVTSRQATNSAGYLIPSGIVEDTQGNQILHNLIENTGHPGIASWKGTRGKSIRGNIVRFIGYDDWIDHAGNNRGSGMYLQNADDSAEAAIAGNISYYNYTTGMKSYGNTDIWKFNYRHQICAHNAEAGIFHHLDNYGSTNFVATNNYLWRNGTGMRLGYPLGNSGHSNALVANNYVVDTGSSSLPFYAVDGWLALTWTNNVGVSLSNRYVWQLEVSGETGGNIASHTMHGNTYYSSNTGGLGAGPFSINEVNKTLAQWQSDTTEDADATHSYVFPSVTTNYVFYPSTDTNYIHVAVFNWGLSNTISVNLSSFVQAGRHLAIYDVQNFPTAYRELSYGGGAIDLDCSLTNRAAMLGTFTQRSDSWGGFDPQLRAFIIYASDVPIAPAIVGQGRSKPKRLALR